MGCEACLTSAESLQRRCAWKESFFTWDIVRPLGNPVQHKHPGVLLTLHFLTPIALPCIVFPPFLWLVLPSASNLPRREEVIHPHSIRNSRASRRHKTLHECPSVHTFQYNGQTMENRNRHQTTRRSGWEHMNNIFPLGWSCTWDISMRQPRPECAYKTYVIVERISLNTFTVGEK